MTKNVFFIGIKGVGMTSLALAMQDAGYQVSGSDTGESFITDKILSLRQIKVVSPIEAQVPTGTDMIIYSGAYLPTATTIPTFPLAVALADFVKERQVIAVAGVGGKTTTTAMLAALFHAAGRDVGYYVGTGSIAGLAAPGAAGTDPYYIVEADEYVVSKNDKRPKFLLLNPQILITTNIIHDHPDVYPSLSDTLAAFTQLVAKLPQGGTWIACTDDPLTQQIIAEQSQTLQGQGVKIVPYDKDHPLYSQLDLSVFGAQNKLDAVAAVLAAIAAGLTKEQALEAIKSYRGAGRRQELCGEVQGRLLYDDYGHHPQEIELTLNSFKEHFPGRRILLVFESHTYTRTEALQEEFARAVALADLPFIMPIFESAREKGQPHTITPDSFVAAIKQHNERAVSVTWENAADLVWAASREGDIILTMGAGFVYKLHEQFKLH